MGKKKQYEHPAMIVVRISGKDGLMSAMSNEPANVRGHRGDIDWDEEGQ